jgi:hypothetical protein
MRDITRHQPKAEVHLEVLQVTAVAYNGPIYKFANCYEVDLHQVIPSSST